MKLKIEKPILKSLTLMASLSRTGKDGDIGFWRVCGAKHRFHRRGDTFEIESSGGMGTAEHLKPRPEMHSIESFVSRAPHRVQIE